MSKDTTFSLKHPKYNLISIYCYSPADGRKAFFLIRSVIVHASCIWHLHTVVNKTVIVPVKGNSSSDLDGI